MYERVMCRFLHKTVSGMVIIDDSYRSTVKKSNKQGKDVGSFRRMPCAETEVAITGEIRAI